MYIVNLSTLHKLHPDTTSIAAFIDLCNRYSEGLFSSCPNFFQTISSTIFVWRNYFSFKPVITEYKLGKLTTEQFLNEVLAIFPFLSQVSSEDVKIQDLNNGQSYSNRLDFALIEQAWNAIIAMDTAHEDRLAYLKSVANDEQIVLISNTNELNVLKIIRLLKKCSPVEFYNGVDLSDNNKGVIEIAKGISIYFSYQNNSTKTQNDDSFMAEPLNTPSLLKNLIDKDNEKEKIHVVSQFAGDRKEALNLGIPAYNVHEADKFFEVKPQYLSSPNF